MTTPDAATHAAAYTPAPGSLRGRFFWYELATTDVEAAVRFYGGLTGWTTTSYDAMDPPYTMFMRGEIPAAGVWTLAPELREAGVPPNWLPYIGTEDVEATVEQATALGASVMVPGTDVPGIGRIAILTDPQGGAFGLYRPSDAPLPEARAEVGEFSWFELHADDHAAAFDFYATLFGWRVIDEHEMQPGWKYRIFGRGDAPVGGMFSKGEMMKDVPTHWQLYVRVADVKAAVERLKQLGGTVQMGPHEVPGGDLIANVVDPQGAHFSLHEVRS